MDKQMNLKEKEDLDKNRRVHLDSGDSHDENIEMVGSSEEHPTDESKKTHRKHSGLFHFAHHHHEGKQRSRRYSEGDPGHHQHDHSLLSDLKDSFIHAAKKYDEINQKMFNIHPPGSF